MGCEFIFLILRFIFFTLQGREGIKTEDGRGRVHERGHSFYIKSGDFVKKIRK